jgi:ADP-ribose pyrophosphatase
MGEDVPVSGIIRRARAREVYANPYVVVNDDDVIFGDGSEGRYVRIQTAGGAGGAVVLATHADRIALVRVYRYPIGRWQWGLPRGFPVTDDPLQTARVELREEIGMIEATSTTVLGSFTPDSGIQSASVHVVWTAVPEPSERPTDTAEVAEVRWVTHDVLDGMIQTGELDDGMTLAALAIAARHPEFRF